MISNNLIYKSYYSWWKNINKSVLFLIIILFGLGLFFSLVSTSLIASDKLNTNSYHFFIKHFLFIGAGSVILTSMEETLKEYFIKDPGVSTSLVVGATITLVIAGTIAAWVPANRASLIKPIDALRDE